MIGKIPTGGQMGRELGGTEYMAEQVMSRFFNKLDNLKKYNWVLIPDKNHDQDLAKKNKNIIWVHVPGEELPLDYEFYFKNKIVRENTVAYIVQSQFHKKNISERFGIHQSKIHVLNNAIDPLPYKEKESGKHVQFIYTPQPQRGVDILVNAFKQIKDKNISLVIHSVFKCSCGNASCDLNIRYKNCMEDSRIYPIGWQDRESYIKNLQSSHVFLYPCLFQETGAIAVMEAMSAGVRVYTSELGVLPEMTNGFAKIMPGFSADQYLQQDSHKKYVKITKKFIKKAIKEARNRKFNPQDQVSYINNNFSFDQIEKQWIAFNDFIGKIDK